jgi:hypothetical protein
MARRRPAEPAANPARGAALVVVAVLIGLVLLRNGLDTSEAITTTGGSPGTDSSASDGDGGDGGDDGTTTTSTTVVVREPAEVPTIVLNDSGVGGAAKKYSDALAARGYALTNPAGANENDSSTTSEVTIVYFAEGFEAEAAAVVAAIGAPATVVPAALPDPPPGPIASASVVVVLGTDLASLTPPAP